MTSRTSHSSSAVARGRSHKETDNKRHGRRSTSRGGSFVARLRSRSASISRNAGRRNSELVQQSYHENENNYDEDDQPPTSLSSPTLQKDNMLSQVEEMIERHNLTLKMDMMEVLQAREKEVKFWKNKAMKLRRKVSTIEGNGGGAADLGAASSSSALEAEDPDQSSDGHDGVEQGLMARTTILERELQDREVQIESLRGIMDTQEKQSEERVRLLESQLERIVEIQSSIRRGSLGSSTADITDVMSDSDKEEHSSTRLSSSSQNEHSSHEVSALEQLLARVLAEKDRLSFENDNLRSVIKDARGGSEDKSLNKTLPADADENDVMYQLSCRLCEGNTYIGSTSGQDLKKVAKDHFSTVWKIVSQDEGGSSNSHAKAHSLDITYGEYDDNDDDDDFRNKPLARHLAECHCHNLNTEEEVRKWCKKYVKLEKLTPGESDDMHRSCEF